MTSGMEHAAATLGHLLFGSGDAGVFVLNDWMSDTSSWDDARGYLDRARLTWAFTDLRGYGRSRGWVGQFTITEAAADVVALADALGWTTFSVVGHSMSSLVALHLAQQHPARVRKVVALTPPPPAGFGVDEAGLAGIQALARADDATRLAGLSERFGTRLSPTWTAFKAGAWRSSADAEAVARYAAMFARDGLPDRTTAIAAPVLAITGEQDVPPMRRDAVAVSLGALCRELTVSALTDCGHYPMQECPPLTAALIERFLVP